MSDNRLRRVVANAALLVAGKGMNALFSLAYLALAARTLGLEGLGYLILIHTYAQAVGEIARFQSSEAILRFGAPALQHERPRDLQTLIGLTSTLDIAGGAGAAALAMLLCGLAAGFIGLPAELIPAATLYCLSILFTATATATGLLRLLGRFDLLATQSAIASFIRLVGTAILFIIGGGVTAFLAVWFVATMIANTSLAAFAWREVSRRGLLAGWRFSFASRGRSSPFVGLWPFIGATQLNTSLAMLSTHLATLLAGGLLGASEAALYRIARELADAVAKPTKLLIPAIYPELAQLTAAGSGERIRALVRHSLALAGFAAAVCFLAIWAGGEFLLRLIAGDAAAPAHPLMILLGAAALTALAAFPLEPLLICVGRERDVLRARVAAIALYVLLISLLIPAFGLIGAGLAAIAAALVMTAGQAIPARRWLSQAQPFAAPPAGGQPLYPNSGR